MLEGEAEGRGLLPPGDGPSARPLDEHMHGDFVVHEMPRDIGARASRRRAHISSAQVSSSDAAR